MRPNYSLRIVRKQKQRRREDGGEVANWPFLAVVVYVELMVA